MKSVLTTCAVLAVLTFTVGCGGSSSVQGPGGKKLTLTKPMDTSIKQGDTASVKVSITREKFSDPVTIKFDTLPKGVEVGDSDNKIAASDKDRTFTLKAAADAALVDNHEASVTAEASDVKVTEKFKISVKAK